MCVTPCTHCTVGWNKQAKCCSVLTGAEHFPVVPDSEIPPCPIQLRCQHQIQSGAVPCLIRRRGMVCESALVAFGMSEEAFNDPRSFNADTAATAEEWAGEEI